MVDAAQVRAFATLNRFYGAFRELDGETMQGCYAEQAAFDDPAFSLRGRVQVGGMWRMLCEGVKARGREAWRLDFSGLATEAAADGHAASGRAHWEAHYLFSATGRPVHNRIDSVFTFDEAGLIATHRDGFDFWRWSRQAFGAPGVLLGWTPWLRAKVRTQAASRLASFLARTDAG
jgi:hypothetical protein